MLGAIPMGMAQQFMQQKEEKKIKDVMGYAQAKHPKDPAMAMRTAAMDMFSKGDVEKGAAFADQASQLFDMKLAEQKQALSEKRWKTEADRVKAYAKSIDAQTKKWEADSAAGKGMPAPVRTLMWAEETINNPDASEAERAAANQIKINYSKGQKDLPTKNFMTFVDKQLANRSFGDQKLKEDMEPAAYQELISEVSLLAHQMRADNTKLKMKDSIEQAWTMTSPMLREQSWWEPGADLELRREAPKKGEVRTFNTPAEAEAAGLPSGTEIMINGRRAVIE
jgi:hypothetical protein